MHHLPCRNGRSLTLTCLLFTLIAFAPDLVLAQASPFMTGATAIQSKGRTLLAAATRIHEAYPDIPLRAFALLRTMGLAVNISRMLDPCVGRICWRAGDARRSP